MRFIHLGTLVGLLVALAACNTASGFGRDLQSAGAALEEASGQ